MCSNSDLGLFRDWLKKQKHLPSDVDDNYIKSFIVASKGSLQKAKCKYEKFHMIRHLLEEYGVNWDPFSPEENGFVDKVALVRLPKKSPEGYSIFLSRLIADNSVPDERHSIKWVTRLYFLVLCGLWDNDLGDCQMMMINDWTDLKLANMKGLTPTFLKAFSEAISDGVPLRIKATHDIGVSTIFEVILNTVNSLVPKKQRDRRFAYANRDKLFNHIPKEYLPSDYDGKGPSLVELNEATKKTFRRHLDKLVGQKAQVAAEAPFVPKELRPESKDTFKKLDFD